MRKSLITTLVYLMAIIIIGLIGIQYFFIKISYQEKHQIYDQSIYSALQKATSRLNSRQSVMFIYNKLNKSKADSIKPVDPTMFSLTYPDGTNINVQFKMQKRASRFLNNDIGPENIYDENLGVNNPEEYFNYMLKHNRDKLYSMMNELESEVIIRNMPLSKLYTREALKEVLSEELKSQGIEQNFDFAVIENNKNIHPHLKSDDFYKGDLSDAYKVNLRPNAIFRQPEYLAVVIPEQNKFILESISMQVTLSIIFVLLILTAFFISTYLIFRQKRLSEMKSDFISNMTHEFKTPIATIKLAADSLLNKNVVNDAKKRNQFTGIISQETKRLNTQVEKVLEVSSLDKDSFSLELEKRDVHEIIEEAVKNMKLNIKQAEAEINIKLNAENSVFYVDKEHMLNVFKNLIDNSIKYSGDKRPEIEIKTYNKNNWLYITVKDNGIGMDSTTVSKVFDKFYRATSVNIHNVKGFGLGLHYVKGIITAHKGLIDLKSTPGKGSTFIIKLIKN